MRWLSHLLTLISHARGMKFFMTGMEKSTKKNHIAQMLGCMLCACPGQDSDVKSICGSQGFPEAPLDVTMPGLFYQTSTAVFRSICFFNSWLRCRGQTISLEKYDVQFRKFVCCIAGPPPGTNWSAQTHIILHEWNMRVDHWSHASGLSS